jgi:feruloyl esterase
MIYDAACTSTTKGYITYNGTRNAFDVLTTSPTGGATTTGGTASGSAIFGQVGAVTVPIFLVRESATSYGMRIYAPQQTFASGTADGHFLVASNNGDQPDATVTGSSFVLGSASGTLSFDTPVLGVVQTTASGANNFIYNGGLIGIVSGSGASFELGVKN